MTLSQLRAFALVAQLGSLRAAATALGISEPAVSSALAALRRDLGDRLYLRSGGGIALTPGGVALAEHAQEMVGLADKIHWEVAHAASSTGGLRVLVTAAFAEHAAPRLFDAFTARLPGAAGEVDVCVGPASSVGARLVDHSCDIALGARPVAAGPHAKVVPFLRYQRILVAAREHPLSRYHRAHPGSLISADQLLVYPWFAGPAGVEQLSEEDRWLGTLSGLPDVLERASEAEGLSAVRRGEGVMLALGHVVRGEIDAGTLERLPVAGTPISGLWCASTLDPSRASAAARALQSFVTSIEATAAMLATGASPAVVRRGSPVHVGLWSASS
ncbi:LysR family transcriptional regulator [Cryobacterium frigoriphilum]|uniref:LysR family transcriptional regulator n=1 Tax=Cryobacterium frigoriphilum TaxID=1259150 RepID=A0A4R9A240_9MICO|nr:LysR family transcriptional regulator [Cryobacterium frigoriphilum]TFD50650.1 LysR family transcriptional regulator [Cryobacterium frigoriphilum]